MTPSAPVHDVAALILAGGKATRLGGIAKHALLVDGKSILARQTSVLAPIVREILVASPDDIPGYRCVRDVPGGSGPLAGIAAALEVVTTEWMLIVAGDMPDLSRDVLALLLEPEPEPEPDARGFCVNGLPEPLLCVVRVQPARVAIATLLADQRFKASGLLEALRVHWITEAALRAVDPALRSLRNINTPADLKPEI